MAPGDPVRCQVHEQERLDLIWWAEQHAVDQIAKTSGDPAMDMLIREEKKEARVNRRSARLINKFARILRQTDDDTRLRQIQAERQEARRKRRAQRRSQWSSPKRQGYQRPAR